MTIKGLDERTVRAVARREGLRAGPTEKALHLVALLEEIGRDSYLKTRLALKGGTALNLFYGRMPRLSVDADFDYIGRIDKEGMQKERGRFCARLEEAGTNLGFAPEREKDAHAGAAIKFRYAGPFGDQGVVKLDVNFLNRVTVMGKVEWKQSTFGTGADPVPVPCLCADELAGFKLGTLCTRAAPRDLFDVASFGRLTLDKRLVRKIALFRGFLEALDLSLFDPASAQTITQQDLDDKVTPLLMADADANRKALLDSAGPWLDSLLPLTQSETEFQTGLLEGRADPALLFESFPVNDSLALHPALLRRLAVKKRSRRDERD